MTCSDRRQERLRCRDEPDHVHFQLLAEAVERKVFKGAREGNTCIVDQPVELTNVFSGCCKLGDVSHVESNRRMRGCVLELSHPGHDFVLQRCKM